MGNQESTFEKELQTWSFQFETIDPCFGVIKVYTKGQDQICLMRKTTDETTAGKKAKPLCVLLEHPKAVGSIMTALKEYCSQFNLLTLACEYVTNSLLKNVILRREKGKGFTEGQLWTLLYQTSSALHAMKENGNFHLDLTPANILFSNSGQVKLLDRSLTNNKISGLQQVLMGIREDLHLSPEEISSLKDKRANHNNVDPGQCDIFQLGLSCLIAATLKSSDSLYLEQSDFDYIELGERLQFLDSLYNPALSTILRDMMQQEPERRPVAAQVMRFVEQQTNFATLDEDITAMEKDFVKIVSTDQSGISVIEPKRSNLTNLTIQSSNTNTQQRPPLIPIQGQSSIIEPFSAVRSPQQSLGQKPPSLTRDVTQNPTPSAKELKKNTTPSSLNSNLPHKKNSLHQIPLTILSSKVQQINGSKPQSEQKYFASQSNSKQQNSPYLDIPVITQFDQSSKKNDLLQQFSQSQKSLLTLGFQSSRYDKTEHSPIVSPQYTVRNTQQDLKFISPQNNYQVDPKYEQGQSKLSTLNNVQENFSRSREIDSRIQEVLQKSSLTTQKYRRAQEIAQINQQPKERPVYQSSTINDEYIQQILRQAQKEIQRSRCTNNTIK